LLTVAVNFAAFGYVLLFRIIFLLTNLCLICCVLKLENPTLVSTGVADKDQDQDSAVLKPRPGPRL